MFRLINSFIIKWFDACPICGCKERDYWVDVKNVALICIESSILVFFKKHRECQRR